MKRLFFSLLFIFFYLNSIAQMVITMESDGGVYKIPCIVNGAKMKLVFDTGASTVCLSQSMAEYLLENDFINKRDFTGSGTSIVADGSIVNNMSLKLRDIDISGLHLRDVDAVIIEGQKAPLLLGLSAINKLGRISINGNLLTVMDANPNNSQNVDELFEKASQYRNDGIYSKAEDCYAELYALDQLSDYGLYVYAQVCYLNHNDKQAQKIVDEITDYKWFDDNEVDIYYLIGTIYSGTGLYREAISYLMKSFDFPSNTYEDKSMIASVLAMAYYNLDSYKDAENTFRIAMFCTELQNGLRQGYILDDCLGKLKKNEKSYKNAILDTCAFMYFRSAAQCGSLSLESSMHYIAVLSQHGNQDATRYLTKLHTTWREVLELF